MRSEADIQRAHDLLIPFVIREVPVEISDETRKLLRASVDALYWVLEHDHNSAFSKNLQELEALARASGYVLNKALSG